MSEKLTLSSVRIDKWLWAARFFKTRRLAKEAIDAGKVRCEGVRVKPAKEITVGLSLTIRQGIDEKVIVVDSLSDQRRGAPEATKLYSETEASRLQRERLAAERKAGFAGFVPAERKPNKKARRQIHRFKRSSLESGED
ncbi:MAG: S4 domain-containing protein [Gammaproteobacteria bacterium]|nr:S4 domain-containing protein [Gammaproteobacteria bacterium]